MLPTRFALSVLLIPPVLLLLPSLSYSAPPTTGTLLLSFRDSRSGAVVVPETVQVDGQPVSTRVDPAGLLSARLGGGRHQVRVEAKGYAPFEGTVSIEGEETPVTTFELDRETSPTAEGDEPETDPKQAGLEGYIVDSARGSLLAGAEVQIPPRNISVRTDSQGYFSLTVPVPSANVDGPPVTERISLKVSKEEFIAEERRNVEIVSGTTMTVTVQLDRLTSDSEPVRIVDEGRSGYRLHSWRFDVTVE